MGKRITKKLTDEHIKVLMALIDDRLELVVKLIIQNLPSVSKDKKVFRPSKDLGDSFATLVSETIEIAEFMYCSAKDKKLKSDIRTFINEIQSNITVVNISPNKGDKSHATANN